jgi:cysteine desulfurase/selenocysteine lyase
VKSRIYLDNAATSWPKPESVYAAVDGYLREIGAAASRGGYQAALQSDQIVADTRDRLRRLIGARSSRSVVMTFNGTDGLNTVIRGCLRHGDHVVTTDIEHNSVLRPLKFLESQLGIAIDYAPCDECGRVDPAEIDRHLRPQTRLVVVSHASNVTGTLQPIDEIAAQLTDHDALLLVDAAQTLGHVPIDVEALGVDALASSGHKGLLGPLGTGVLYLSSRAVESVHSLRQGGTGTTSETDIQPAEPPEKYESGNLNVVGIAGLGAGCQYLLDRGVDDVHRQLTNLDAQLRLAITELPAVEVFGPPAANHGVGITSFRIPGYEPQEIAAVLDASFGIQVRAGLHCAPRMHRSLGTIDVGGTIRASLGPFNNEQDVAAVVDALRELAPKGDEQPRRGLA